MSDLFRWALHPRYRASIVELFPGVTAAQLVRLDDLILSDRFIKDDGEPHPCLLNWVRAVLDRGDDAAPAMALPSPPLKPTPSGAEVAA